jgi:ABC-2 type transport system ATP-binding protein
LDALLVARDLHKSFGQTRAVSGVSLQVRSGEIFGLVGPDGAGKTTTMRLLCGALVPDSGDVEINGVSMRRHPDEAREGIGYLSQQFSLYQDLTVLENLRFFAEVRGIPPSEWRKRAMELLDFVGLAEFSDRRAGHLSGGMRQKMGLATALVHRPQLLLLDEPTGGVDPLTRQDFWQLIIRLVTDERLSVLVSTPYMDEAGRCTYVGFMNEGVLVISDSPAHLRERLKDRILEVRGDSLAPMVQRASADPAVQALRLMSGHMRLQVAEGTAEQVIQRVRRIAERAGAEISEVRIVRPQLEDVFNALLEEGAAQSAGEPGEGRHG